ncbi:MAG: cell cycle transcriptional regulator TrcR [Pseudomonadota bacterium]|jgi:hypothetical protein|nr:DUF1013 domain-containing protein [Alphaproteobacteria bacterium]
MTTPLMPKATAVWLIENTSLTFKQIATFCGLHALEVQNLADSETTHSMVGFDPLASGQLTLDEIHRCEKDNSADLKISIAVSADSVLGKKRSKYTPLSKRQERPDAISWLIKYYPDLTDTQISRLVGTTKITIDAVRNKSHWNAQNIKPRSPVHLGFCTESELNEAVKLLKKTQEAS